MKLKLYEVFDELNEYVEFSFNKSYLDLSLMLEKNILDRHFRFVLGFDFRISWR